MMKTIKQLVQESKFATKDIEEDQKDGAEARWQAKELLKRQCVYDVHSMNHAELRGAGTLQKTNKKVYSNEESSLLLSIHTDIEDIKPRPTSSIVIPFDKEDWRMYNRVSVYVYPESVGHQNFYFHFSLQNEHGKGLLHAPSLTPNQWNHVLFEIPLMKKEAIIRFSMSPWITGCPPEAISEVNFYFSSVYVEEIEMDDILGWNAAERISYSHSGYFTSFDKLAITGSAVDKHFKVLDLNKTIVLNKKLETMKNEYGLFYIADFTSIQEPGQYCIQIDDRITEYFEISDRAFESALWKSANFLRLLRCGTDIEGVHSPCHLTHHTAHPDGRLVSDSGGWHDAGDVSQFEICTAEMAHALVDLAEQTEQVDQDLSDRLLDEARWGLNWLLKTHFGDGYRALAVHYSIWRRNYLKSYEVLNPEFTDFPKDTAENGPFENFLASAALAAAYRVFKKQDQVFAEWCLRIGMKDFEFGLDGYEKGIFTKRWGKGPESQVAGALILAASELYVATKDEKYIDVASIYAKDVMDAQQVDYPAWKTPIRGFFYEDRSHKTLLTYEHRGHEQSPIHGLVRLLEIAPNHNQASKWMKTIELYAEYIEKTANMVEPYGLLPAHIYRYDQLNMDRFTIPKTWGTEEEVAQSFKDQIRDGILLDDDVYLRRFPIAIQRRGYHATLLSKAKAVSAIAKLLNRKDLAQIAIRQFEWILGKNPFSSSTMYGEGHNYHPLYVAFSRQMVGALPVGIETMGSWDKPYWPVVNNAVYKEIWGHTTGKFLWVYADLLHFTKK